MDFGQYTKVLKILTIIPFLAGLLTIVETILPYKSIETRVISKESKYRAKTESTTFTVNFEGINDQFTEDIYNALLEGDEVELKATYFNKQIRFVNQKKVNLEYENSTSEPWAIYAFGLVFLLSGLVWTRSGLLKNRTAMYLAFVILLGFISLIRMF